MIKWHCGQDEYFQPNTCTSWFNFCITSVICFLAILIRSSWAMFSAFHSSGCLLVSILLTLDFPVPRVAGEATPPWTGSSMASRPLWPCGFVALQPSRHHLCTSVCSCYSKCFVETHLSYYSRIPPAINLKKKNEFQKVISTWEDHTVYISGLQPQFWQGELTDILWASHDAADTLHSQRHLASPSLILSLCGLKVA